MTRYEIKDITMPESLRQSMERQMKAERDKRALAMVEAMEKEAFGACTNFRACEATCPKEISISGIARMNKDWRRALLRGGTAVSGKRK